MVARLHSVVSLAVILIVIAIVLGALGLFTQGAGLLFWIGVVVLVAAVIAWMVERRPGPPA